MFKLKRVLFDKYQPLDVIDNDYTVLCFENLNFVPLKDCLDLMAKLCLGLCFGLFLFDVLSMWPDRLRETLMKQWNMINNQNDP